MFVIGFLCKCNVCSCCYEQNKYDGNIHFDHNIHGLSLSTLVCAKVLMSTQPSSSSLLCVCVQQLAANHFMNKSTVESRFFFMFLILYISGCVKIKELANIIILTNFHLPLVSIPSNHPAHCAIHKSHVQLFRLAGILKAVAPTEFVAVSV